MPARRAGDVRGPAVERRRRRADAALAGADAAPPPHSDAGAGRWSSSARSGPLMRHAPRCASRRAGCTWSRSSCSCALPPSQRPCARSSPPAPLSSASTRRSDGIAMNSPFHGASRCVVSDENGRPPADHAAGARLRRSASSAAGLVVAMRRRALQPRGGRAVGQRAQVELGGVEQHLADRQRRERRHVRARARARRRAARARLALQVGGDVEAGQRPAQRRAGGPVRQRRGRGGGARRAAARRARRASTSSCSGASACAITLASACTRSQPKRRWSTRCSLPPSAPMASAACTSRSGALSAIVSAPTRRLATSSATGLRSEVGAVAAARGRRLRRQRRDAHGVGHPGGERRAEPRAGMRMPVQVQAGRRAGW